MRENSNTDYSEHPVTVFYHAPCLDGAAAAWAAHERYGDSAHYVPINHGDAQKNRDLIFENITENSHVIFADFLPSPETVTEVADFVQHVDLYDHHATELAKFKAAKLFP